MITYYMEERQLFTMVDSSDKSTQNYLPLGRPRPVESGFRSHLVNLVLLYSTAIRNIPPSIVYHRASADIYWFLYSSNNLHPDRQDSHSHTQTQTDSQPNPPSPQFFFRNRKQRFPTSMVDYGKQRVLSCRH